MKSQTIIRFLSLFAVLLLMAPFYDSCNSKKVEAEAVEVVEEAPLVEEEDVQITKDSIPAYTEDNAAAEIIIEEPSFLNKLYSYIDDDLDTYNAYEFAYQLHKIEIPSSFQEFNKEIRKPFAEGYQSILISIIIDLLFVFIIIGTYVSGFLSFMIKNSVLFKVVKFNIILVLLVVVLIPYFPFFETYKQIKWGYYAFTFNQFLLFYYLMHSNKNMLSK